MSSFSGTPAINGQEDPTLQLAPPGNAGPDFGSLKKSFEDCVSDLQPYIDQCRQNYETRYALWNGQSSDGKKHSRPQNGVTIDPQPWDGASDSRIYLNDEAINSKVAMLCTSFRRATIVANPVEGNDLKRAKTVANFMRWLVQTQMPEIQREAELLANYINEKGVGVTGQFWETCQEKTLATVSLQTLQQEAPNLKIDQLIFAPEAENAILGHFEEVYNCSTTKARKMLRELRGSGTTTVATLGRERSYPVVRAFNLDEDLFIPHFTTDLESASAIYRVQYFTAEKLRSFVHSDNWDAGWVEDAIEKCRGRLITIAQNEYNQPIARSFVYQQQRFTDLIGVVYAYQRLSDEDGVPGIYLTIFNPQLPPVPNTHEGYAKFGLLGYAHGQYPFILHRREYLSRKLHDSRGIPEPGKPAQENIKAHRDSRIDAASIAMVPPMGYPIGRPPGKWGAGARVPERRPNEYHFLDRPAPDPITERSEEILLESFYRYFGFVSRDSDPTFANLKNQQEVDKWLYSWGLAMRQVFKLYQQFGSDEVFFRVIGLKQEDAVRFSKGDPSEDFDFFLTYQVESMNPDVMFQKLEQIAKIVATADRDGVVNYSEWLQVMIESVDPTIADRIIDPKNVGAARVVQEMQDMLAKVYAGQDQDIKLGTPPDLGLQVIQGYVQGDPVVQARMQNKQDPFGQRVQKLAKQLQFQKTQQQNAKIGRMGA